MARARNNTPRRSRVKAEPAPTTTPKPRRVKPDPAPTTPDPIEIAMEAEATDTSADSPARRLLIDQGRLVRWQSAD